MDIEGYDVFARLENEYCQSEIESHYASENFCYDGYNYCEPLRVFKKEKACKYELGEDYISYMTACESLEIIKKEVAYTKKLNGEFHKHQAQSVPETVVVSFFASGLIAVIAPGDSGFFMIFPGISLMVIGLFKTPQTFFSGMGFMVGSIITVSAKGACIKSSS